MKGLTIDCKTGRKTRRKFAAEEAAARLAEVAEAEAQEHEMERARRVRALLDAAADLERAGALRTEGVLSDGDVAELRRRVDALKAELSSDA